MQNQELLPHLFRTEFRKITSVICKLYGFDHIEAAEDMASETFLAAAEIWPFKGLPPNPTAWLYTVAKNKAKNYFTRQALFANKIMPNVAANSQEIVDTIEWSDAVITDSQLQMMFAICDPVISTEAQVCLALRILCGFGIDEIANAFLSNKETINKRLHRAKNKLREANIKLEIPQAKDINNRLETVLICLYLLFNEGYYSESDNTVLRQDLCAEAMLLAKMLLDHTQTNTPAVNALYALMCLHSSRFAARENINGEPVLYDDQDESLWDKNLIAEGAAYLQKASTGNTVSKYHIEASIAYWHTIKEDSTQKWRSILDLYNHLLQIAYSPIAALNRTYALYKVYGAETALEQALKLSLTDNPYYFTLLGELYKDLDVDAARESFTKALGLAKTTADKQIITKKLKKT